MFRKKMQIQIFCTLICFVAFVRLATTTTSLSRIVPQNETCMETICSGGSCMTADKCKIVRSFPGLFLSVDTIEKMVSKKKLNEDYDICCSTFLSFAIPSFLMNTYGARKRIVQGVTSYQYIPKATCQPITCQSCDLRNRTISLLVWNTGTGPEAKFDYFSVPVYCGCSCGLGKVELCYDKPFQ